MFTNLSPHMSCLSPAAHSCPALKSRQALYPITNKSKACRYRFRKFAQSALLLTAGACLSAAAPVLTSTTLSLSTDSIKSGRPFTITATVSPITNGQIVIYDGTNVLATAQLDNGLLVLNRSLGAGTHTLTASFVGNASYSPSTSEPKLITADWLAPTTTAIEPDFDKGTLTAFVTSEGPSAPTGSVSFKENGHRVRTQNLASLTPQQTFGVQQLSSVGSHPLAVVAGDFNNDGVPDIAVANGWSHNISVLLGERKHTYEPQVTYDAGATTLAVGDFNNDGIEDLVVANGGHVGVLLGNGDGTFQTQATYPGALTPSAIVVGDFNRDGIQDVAVADYQNDAVVVLIGKGDGSFPKSQPPSYPVGTKTMNYGIPNYWPQSIAAGDFNNDGIPDLVTANLTAGNVSILLGKGDGTFAFQSIWPVGKHPESVSVGDFNDDGVQDLAVGNELSGNVSVLMGQGGGAFASQISYPIGSGVYSLAIGDMNGDGKRDLVTSNTNSTVSLLLGKGDGTFTLQSATPPVAVGPYPFSLALADLNRDGIQDVVVANGGNNESGDDTISVLPGQLIQTASAENRLVVHAAAHARKAVDSILGIRFEESTEINGETGEAAESSFPSHSLRALAA